MSIYNPEPCSLSITQINEAIAQCISKRAYHQADILQQQLQALQTRMTIQEKHMQQQKLIAESDALHRSQIGRRKQINQRWIERLEEFDRKGEDRKRVLKERHQQEMVREKQQVEMKERRMYRESIQILNLRKSYQQMVKQKCYQQAALIEPTLQALVNQSHALFQSQIAIHIAPILSNIQLRHQKQLQLLEDRIMRERQKMLAAREKEFYTCQGAENREQFKLSSLKNVSSLEGNSNSESVRIESVLEINNK